MAAQQKDQACRYFTEEGNLFWGLAATFRYVSSSAPPAESKGNYMKVHQHQFVLLSFPHLTWIPNRTPLSSSLTIQQDTPELSLRRSLIRKH